MFRISRGALASGGIVVAVAGILLAQWHYRSIPEIDFRKVASAVSSAPLDDRRPVLRVAVSAMISPSATKRYYDDLVRVIADKVGRRAALVQRQTYAEVNALIENKNVDLAFVCSGPYVMGHEEFGMELIAVPIVDGKPVYYAYILARRGAGISSFEDLRGKRFAFTDPDSNTGSLVPRFMLAQRRETPESFFTEAFFTHGHDNSIKAVAEGLADGASVDSLIWDFLRTTHSNTAARTVIIQKSRPYGIPPWVVHPALDPDLKADLKKVLLSLHTDPSARRALEGIRIQRFVEGNDASYQSVRDMQAWIAAER